MAAWLQGELFSTHHSSGAALTTAVVPVAVTVEAAVGQGLQSQLGGDDWREALPEREKERTTDRHTQRERER